MKCRTHLFANRPWFKFSIVPLALCGIALLEGCGPTEKEPEPLVAVQVAAAKRGPIEQTISAEAVVSSLQQAVITPKITSTIRKFYVQRGSRVKQGQLLAELENADLASAEQQSKGEYEQAEAGYATTTEASLPQQIQKAELDAAAANPLLTRRKKCMTRVRSSLTRAPCRGEIWMQQKWHWLKPVARTSRRKSSSSISIDLAKTKR